MRLTLSFGYLGCVLFPFSFKTIHFTVCADVSVWPCECERLPLACWFQQRSEEDMRLLEVEFQAVVSFAVWALGFGHGSSGTAEILLTTEPSDQPSYFIFLFVLQNVLISLYEI